ncbi:MAG: deaminase [Candidatus Saccharimonadales bacterium]
MDNAESNESLISYVPVIHTGYLEMFERYRGADMHVLDQDILDQFSHLRKDIRALSPDKAREIVESLEIFSSVKLLGAVALEGFRPASIVMPDDEISHKIREDYLGDREVIFEPVFLRWDRNNSFVNVEVQPDRVIDASRGYSEIIDAIYNEAGKSSDWWRRVGAAIVESNGEIVNTSHNYHLPTEYSPWIDGDPRNNATRGSSIEASTVQHAESSLIAKAAKEGISLEGKSIFVTTFPCPPCAKLIAESGLESCYYVEGYAMTDGLRVMKNFDVEVVKIEGVEPRESKGEFKEYPDKKK